MCGKKLHYTHIFYGRNGNAIYYIPHSVVRHNVEGEFGQIQMLGLLNVLFTPDLSTVILS